MPNSRLKTVRDEFLTSIDYYDGFHVNLLFDHFFIDRRAHIWVIIRYLCATMGGGVECWPTLLANVNFKTVNYYSVLDGKLSNIL